MATAAVITAAVEGSVDEALVRKICQAAGTEVSDIYGKKGKAFILARINGYNFSARHRHWAVLLDLDSDFPCAGRAAAAWLPQPAPLMCLRVAAREAEAWILADDERIAEFLSVDRRFVPRRPDELADPKAEILNLARRSSSAAIREDLVPHPASGQAIGPAYNSRMIEFITAGDRGWRLEVAARNSPSLDRCVRAITRLAVLPYPPQLPAGPAAP